MEISKDIKNRIIELFTNTRKSISKILQEIAPNGEITLEEFYDVLNEYSQKNQRMVKRKPHTYPSIEISDNQIFELREKGLSYNDIVEYFTKKDITVSVTHISDRCKKIYKEKEKEEPDLRVSVNVPEKEIFELRKQGLSYKDIEEYYANKGIQISQSTVSKKCKQIYEKKGKKVQDLRRVNVPEEEIFELREQGLTYKGIEEYYANKGIQISNTTISSKCKQIYEKKGIKEPDLVRVNVPEEEIFELRKQGLTYKDIEKYYANKGMQMSLSTVISKCKQIYERKGIKESDFRKVKISEEEIFELREQGLTYKGIEEYYANKGIKISNTTISSKCKQIYEKKGRKEPDLVRVNVPEEEIFELREQGLTYKDIEEYYTNKGIQISYGTVVTRCRQIYEKKGIKEPDFRRVKVSEKEIYELREQGLTYEGIEEYYANKGIQISDSTISKKCKQIYKEKGIKELEQDFRKVKVPKEEIFELREQGLSYRSIAQHFIEKGIKVSYESIRNICKELYKQKRRKEPKVKKLELSDGVDEEKVMLRVQNKPYKENENCLTKTGISISYETIGKNFSYINNSNNKEKANFGFVDKNVIKRGLSNLKRTRNATDEQLAKLAEFYGVDLDMEESKEL